MNTEMKCSAITRILASAAAVIVSLTACQEKEPEPIHVTDVTLNMTSLTLTEGDSAALTATVSPSNADNKAVIWSTSNGSVATVNEGVVTAVKEGSAAITVKTDDSGKTATCNVTVTSRTIPVTGVSLNLTELEITEGDKTVLAATVSPEDATNRNVKWSSSDETVATVSNGEITALKSGAVKITVITEDGGKTAECAVTVKEKVYPVESVSLDKESLSMEPGETAVLVATIVPENATNKKVKWESSDSGVASVDENGIVTAVKAGFATIKVTTEDGGKTAECAVTVKVNYSNVKDLSSSATANCYIVSAAGDYKFKTVKGNTSTSVASVAEAEVLWETFGTSTAPNVGDLISSVDYENDYILFRYTGAKGNALIAVRDANGIILWSWHIWCTDQPQDQVYNNGAGTMMDRNVGATSATPGDVGALGLLYQWGRKDPFLGSSSISSDTVAKSTITWPSAVSSESPTGTIDYATAHPTTFITYNLPNGDWYYTGSSNTDDSRWCSSKGTYDPCPPGYRVPDGGSTGIWSRAFGTSPYWKTSSNWDSSNRGMNFASTDRTLGSGTIWYPASGYLGYIIGNLSFVGDEGHGWSCTPRGARAYLLSFNDSGTIEPSSDLNRAYGHSVRCVREE